MLYVRQAIVTQTVAPAAGAFFLLRGTVSAAPNYAAAVSVAAIASYPMISPPGILIGDSGQLDPAEGLNGVNNSTQPATFSVSASVVPVPWTGPGTIQ